MTAPKKMTTINITVDTVEKINAFRGGVSISDFVAELVDAHIKKQKKIPPEVVDKAEVT